MPKVAFTDDTTKLWYTLNNWTRSIEIMYKCDNHPEILTRVYFPFNPAVSQVMPDI